MKTINLRHETFIREMLTHGNRAQAYMAAYPGTTCAAAYNNACRLLKNEYIRAGIEQPLAAIKDKVLAELRETYQNDFADMAEKRRRLARIVRGEQVIPHARRKGSITEIRYTIPTPGQIISAIVLDCKLAQKMQQDDN